MAVTGSEVLSGTLALRFDAGARAVRTFWVPQETSWPRLETCLDRDVMCAYADVPCDEDGRRVQVPVDRDGLTLFGRFALVVFTESPAAVAA